MPRCSTMTNSVLMLSVGGRKVVSADSLTIGSGDRCLKPCATSKGSNCMPGSIVCVSCSNPKNLISSSSAMMLNTAFEDTARASPTRPAARVVETKTMKHHFRFMDLPLELRQQVYAHIFSNYRHVNGATLNDYVANVHENLPPLCQVNTIIRAEAFIAFLSTATFNFSSYPRPHVARIQRYIDKHKMRTDFWYYVRRAHLAIRNNSSGLDFELGSGSSQRLCCNLVEAATSLTHLELTFPGEQFMPSGPKIFSAIGGIALLELLAKRPKLAEIKIIWTINAPHLEQTKEVSDLQRERCNWDQRALHLQYVFMAHDVGTKVVAWLESADRNVWGFQMKNVGADGSS